MIKIVWSGSDLDDNTVQYYCVSITAINPFTPDSIISPEK